MQDDGSMLTVPFTKRTLMPAAWACVEIPKKWGLKIADKAMTTGLEGQFRVLHALRDTKGVLGFFGDFGKGQLYAPSLLPTLYTLHPAPCTLHSAPYTLHPTPYPPYTVPTLRPTPYALHPTPYTLHPKPRYRGRARLLC